MRRVERSIQTPSLISRLRKVPTTERREDRRVFAGTECEQVANHCPYMTPLFPVAHADSTA